MGEPFQFLHCADLHLGAAFTGLSRKLPQIRDLLVDAPFRAWQKIVQLAIRQKVDFAVISGDVHDRSAPSLRGRIEFQKGLSLLDEAGIPVFLVAGNHDPRPAAWSDAVKLPSNVHFFPTDAAECVPFEKNGHVAATVAGISFPAAEEKRNLPLLTGAALANAPGVRIAVVHANLAGDQHASPATDAELKSCAVDYWALGHIHQRHIRSEKPFIVYAGTPQGRNVNEPGAGGAFIVSADHTGSLTTKFFPVSELDFCQLTLSASGADSFEALKDLLYEALAEHAEQGELLFRLNWNGVSVLDAELRRTGSDELYRYFAGAVAEKFPHAHLESVRVLTRGESAAWNGALEEEIRLSLAELKESGELESIYDSMCSTRRELPRLRPAEFESLRNEAAALVSELLSGKLELTR